MFGDVTITMWRIFKYVVGHPDLTLLSPILYQHQLLSCEWSSAVDNLEVALTRRKTDAIHCSLHKSKQRRRSQYV